MIFDRNRDRLFFVSIVVLLFVACASSPAVPPGPGTGPGIAVVPAEKAGLFTGPPTDAMMLNEAVSWLGLSDKPADYAKARETFAVLTKSHPQSKWRPLAETFIHLIDTIAALQAKGLSEQGLSDKLKQDNERLRKELYALGGKFQAERDSLLQENEKLKKDIELLKQLEVQLDKRGKMLR